MSKYVRKLDQHTNAINKINKVLDMKVTNAEQKREEVLLKLIRENYKSRTVKQYVMAMQLVKKLQANRSNIVESSLDHLNTFQSQFDIVD